MDPVIITKAERLPAQLCPACGHTLDACTGLTAKKLPEPGDYTVCAGCVSLLQFGSDRVLRKIELSDVVPDRRELLQHVLATAREVRRKLNQSPFTRNGFVN